MGGLERAVGGVLLGAVLVGCAPTSPSGASSAAASSTSSAVSAPSAAVSSKPAEPDWEADAARVRAACAWSDEIGFAQDCAAMNDLGAHLSTAAPPVQMVVKLLRDHEPRERGLGLAMSSALDEQGAVAAWPTIADAALAETVPALSERMAIHAAHLHEGSPTTDLQARVDRLAREGEPRRRFAFLSFLSADPSRRGWLAPMLRGAAGEADASVRLGAMRGAAALPREDPDGSCELWKAGLTDHDALVRSAARELIVAKHDFSLEDPKLGFLGAHVGHMGTACSDAYWEPALASARADRIAKTFTDQEKAVFFAAVFAKLPKPKPGDVVASLAAIATSVKSPSTARVLAARALARDSETKHFVASLVNDPDPNVAKAVGSE